MPSSLFLIGHGSVAAPAAPTTTIPTGDTRRLHMKIPCAAAAVGLVLFIQIADDVVIGLVTKFLVCLGGPHSLPQEYECLDDVDTSDKEEPHVRHLKLGDVIIHPCQLDKVTVEQEHDNNGDEAEDGELGIDLVDHGPDDGILLVLCLSLQRSRRKW